jgi:hypothetical protein
MGKDFSNKWTPKQAGAAVLIPDKNYSDKTKKVTLY